MSSTPEPRQPAPPASTSSSSSSVATGNGLLTTPNTTSNTTPTPSLMTTPANNATTSQATSRLSIWRSCLSLLLDLSANDERKYEAASQLSEDLELIVEHHSTHRQFFEQTVFTFISYLETTETHYVSENPRQKLRKLILEMIQRLPPVDALKEFFVTRIIKLMAHLFETGENEENSVVILRIFFELHKSCRLEYTSDTHSFMQSIISFCTGMKSYDLNTMFEKKHIVLSEEEFNDEYVSQLLSNMHTITPIEVEVNQQPHPTNQMTITQTNPQQSSNMSVSNAPDTQQPPSTPQTIDTNSGQPVKQTITYHILPRAKSSLKVAAEVPLKVVLLYQLYRPPLQQPVAQLIPLIIDVINMKPPENVLIALQNDELDKEIYVEFISAQIKALSFIAYIVRIFQDTISIHSTQLVDGVLMLLKYCPHEVAHLRKELLVALRYILQTNLRTKFIEHLKTLFDEDILIGTGWTANETLRLNAYHTLADFLHNSKKDPLLLEHIDLAINMFSKNVHDPTLTPQLQLMSCKLLITLSEPLKVYINGREMTGARDLLMRIIEVFVLKFKDISVSYLPHLFQRLKAQQALQTFQNDPSHPNHIPIVSQQQSQIHSGVVNHVQTAKDILMSQVAAANEYVVRDERIKFESSSMNIHPYNINDCKNAVKTMILGLKTIIQLMPSYRCPTTADQMVMFQDGKLFRPKETIVFVRLFKHALKALDIYMIAPNNTNVPQMMGMNKQNMAPSLVRSKEEKEILESFAFIFTNLHPLTFHEIFSKLIGYVIERIHQNFAFQIIVNTFLATPPLSPVFASILLEYLIARMEEIGSNEEMSSLYLRLFKIVFGSVTLYAVENEQMLRPHLQNIVNKSMELALGAKDPFNYFLLLRALFRSIGGGNHDLLYQEFLPLLPNLLQGLNSLQSGLHKQQVKDLFVELCLTVPVRLSSLLPFLPMLMDPLVSALNGPQPLISQGLRTLELCVDNLQPDFLFEHIQPIGPELMQALYRTLRNINDVTAQTSFRVLGKFGGGNRKLMVEPQKLEFIEQKDSQPNQIPLITVHFPDQKSSIDLPIDKVIFTAFENLKTIHLFPNRANINNYYLTQSWDAIKCFIITTIGNNTENASKIKSYFINPNLQKSHIPIRRDTIFKCPNETARKVYQTALTGMFISASINEVREKCDVVKFLNSVVRHHVMLSIGQHLNSPPSANSEGMDPFVIVDALTYVIGHEEKKECGSGYYTLVLIIKTATLLLGSKERASELPLVTYLVRVMYKLCYERAWYSKTGGCIAIRHFTDNMPLSWVLKYQTKFVKALLYVMRDLTGEVSSGAIDAAQISLEHLLSVCGKPLDISLQDDSNLVSIQNKSLSDVTELFIREIMTPNLCVRTQAVKSLELLAKLSNKTVAEVMDPHRKVLEMMLPLFSTQRDSHALEKQPVRTQIGLIYAATYCTVLEPKIFKIDTSYDKHRSYIEQLMRICDVDDSSLKKLPCYQKVTTLAPLKTTSLHALTSCYYLTEYQVPIFKILFKATDSNCLEIREEAYSCMERYVSKVQIDINVIKEEIQPLMAVLQDSARWDCKAVTRISCITKLFPNVFDETLCMTLYEHMKNISAMAFESLKGPLAANERAYDRTRLSHEKMKICSGLIGILVLVEKVEQTFMSKLMALVIKIETSMIMEPGSVLRAPLRKFLRRFPEQTISILLMDQNLQGDQVYRLIKYLLKGEEGEIFRSAMNHFFTRLSTLLSPPYVLRYQAVMVISIMIKYDPDWLVSRPQLVERLQQIWVSAEFHQKHSKIGVVDYAQWNEPKLLMRCLLNYFQRQPSSIDLLFQLLRIYMNRYISDFEFFRNFLSKVVIETYSIEWKREAFAKFVNIFYDNNYPSRLKAKILQCIIIPSFSHSFEKGLRDALLGGPPQPDRENSSNLIHMFINKVIDQVCSGDKKYAISDELRILLLQFCCLLVDQASPHIHEASNRKQSARLKKLCTFAWPCLRIKTCVDPAAKYHGHLLLAHIISKFIVHKRIVTQVFHSLLKAYAPEARPVVRQALEILLPAMPLKLDSGNSFLLTWTKKIINEDGHNIAQLVHMLQLLIRHYKLFYPLRVHLTPNIISSIQRLGYNVNATMEHKRIAIDLCEIIIRWEMQRQREVKEKMHNQHLSSIQQNTQLIPNRQVVMVKAEEVTSPSVVRTINIQPSKSPPVSIDAEEKKETTPSLTGDVDCKQSSKDARQNQEESPMEVDQPIESSQRSPNSLQTPTSVSTPNEISQSNAQAPSSPAIESQSISHAESLQSNQDKKFPSIDCATEPFEQKYIDSILNTLLRLACHLNPSPSEVQQPVSYSSGESLSKRCVMLIKNALRPEMWSDADLRFSSWMDKLLQTSDNPQQCSVQNVCTAIELLSYLCSTLKKDAVLHSFKNLTRGITACMNSQNSRIIKFISSLIQRLTSVFPTQSSNSPTNNDQEELEQLYNKISQIIVTTLSNYENSTQPISTTTLFSSLMVLNAACVNNPSYVDRIIPTFIRVLHKMTREHTTTQSVDRIQLSTDLLILSLDLVKNRLPVMSPELRKQFIQQILSSLIESPHTDPKVLKTIIKTVDEWIKQRSTSQSLNSREKMLLLIKLMLHIEKRLNIDAELNEMFLELINFVYRNDELKATDLTSKLESAFMAGLRCVQPNIRAKFFEVFDQSVKPKLYERLMYIVCAQNWQTIGHHFWIQQCIEFIFAVAFPDPSIQESNFVATSLPSIPTSSDLGTYNHSDYKTSNSLLSMLSDTDVVPPDPKDVEFVYNYDNPDNLLGYVNLNISEEDADDDRKNLIAVLNRQYNFYNEIKKVRVGDFLRSICQLCHINSDLASSMWIYMFPRIWKTLNDQQMTLFGREIQAFLCSGSHIYQKDCHPSSLGTFMEAVSLCRPLIQIRPILLKYLGKNHNVWQRAALMLEDLCKARGLDVIYPVPAKSSKGNQQNQKDFDIITLSPNTTLAEEALESLSEILELMHEDDLWFGLWQHKANYVETRNAIALEQQGMFNEAQEMYESAMDRQKLEFDESCILKPGMKSENRVWEKHWIQCSKELNQWDSLLEYGSMKGCSNPILVLDSAWRVPDWVMMKDALSLVEENCPYDIAWRVALYKGYNFICNPEELALNHVDEMVGFASNYCITAWRKLPKLVSHMHINLLQAAQQVIELLEAKKIHQDLLPANISHSSQIHDMKAIVKTWRNRLPILTDNLSHWSDIFTWRQHHYQAIVATFEAQSAQLNQLQMPAHYNVANCAEINASTIILGAHASAQSIINFGKIARKQGLINVCLDSINRIHTIPSIPIVDCFQKIKQQVKCYMQMPPLPDKSNIVDGLDIIESTNMKFFTKEMIAEFYAMKGTLLAELEKHDDANKAFHAAANLHDMLPKAWSGWGEYMEQRFTEDYTQMLESNPINQANFANRQMHFGVSAVTCYLHACKLLNQLKARKYVAKILWLLSFDDERCQLAELINKYCQHVPPQNWLAWISQLLQCLLRNEGEYLRNLLIVIGRMQPQAVYFPIRTLYFTLKVYFNAQKMRMPQGMPGSPSPIPKASTAQQVPMQVEGSPNPQPVIQTPPRPCNVSSPSYNPTTISAAATNQPTLVQQLQQPPVLSSPGGPIIHQQTVESRQLAISMQGYHQINAPQPLIRCSEIMKKLLDLHPTTLSSLEGIVDQMIWFKEYSYEEVQRQMHQALTKCYALAYENKDTISTQTIAPSIIGIIRKLVATFGVGVHGHNSNYSSTPSGYAPTTAESMAERMLAAAQEPEFQQTKVKFQSDFEESSLQDMKLITLIAKLKVWINILNQKNKLMPKTYLIEDKCRFLSNFSQHTADVELPGESLLLKHHHYYVRIARFMPEVEVVNKYNTQARRIFIRGHNGKVYPYLVVSDSCLLDARREERVLQLLRLLNYYFGRKKETARRLLNFTVPRVVGISPNMRLVEDNPASLSLLDILKRRINHNRTAGSDLDHDSPITDYYDKVTAIQNSGVSVTQKNLTDIFSDIQHTMVPHTLLKEWAAQTYIDATDYWIFRSQFTTQISLAAFAEYVLHLTRLMPEMMYVHQDTGLVNISYFKIDLDDSNGELSSDRPVPFRLTPNLSELITKYGVSGLLGSSMAAAARCLTSPNFKVISILRAILRDEMLYWHKKNPDNLASRLSVSRHDLQGEILITMVNKATNKIFNRLNQLASNDKPLDSHVARLICRASNTTQLSLMDPAWHPWL